MNGETNLRYVSEQVEKMLTERATQALQTPFDGGSGGSYDGPMEARLTILEDFAADAKERLVKIDLRLEQTATKTDIAEIRGDMHKSSTDIARWMIATVISLFLGFGGLFFVMSNSTKPSTPSAAPAPIVIYAQPAPAPAAPPGAQAPGSKS